ncbi:hypothetical protein B4U80_00926, partial [Leptotrombidium deliense]
RSKIALFPKCTDEVSKVLSYCSSRLLPVVVQGGKTSLVGGSVPTNDEIILNMSKMNKILSFDKLTGILECESGCVLQNLEEHVGQLEHTMPYDLGAKGSCQIGGNVATNAAGLHLIRYGSLHGNILGLEVVQASGTVTNLMSSMRKDNTGYDLKQLFIGSEGTLGVITKVMILCPPKPSCKMVLLLSLDNFESVLSLFRETKHKFSEYLSAFEMIDSQSMSAVVDNLKLSKPFNSTFYALVELSTNNIAFVESEVIQFLSSLMTSGIVKNGTYSSETHLVNKLWAYRELIPEALTRDGYCYKYDVSLPLCHYYELVNEMRKILQETNALRVCGYGHVGDFNLHLNITSKQFDEKILNLIEPHVYKWVSDKKGSISAEHGIRSKKRNYLHLSKSKEAIELMMQLKQLMDPKNILNPGKVLPEITSDE